MIGPAITPLSKRVVLKHPSGLYQILGATAEQPDAFVGPDANVTIAGELVSLNLVAARPRYYLYTVVQAPAVLHDFHAQQH